MLFQKEVHAVDDFDGITGVQLLPRVPNVQLARRAARACIIEVVRVELLPSAFAIVEQPTVFPGLGQRVASTKLVPFVVHGTYFGRFGVPGESRPLLCVRP